MKQDRVVMVLLILSVSGAVPVQAELQADLRRLMSTKQFDILPGVNARGFLPVEQC
jgi:hypothetical protein